MNWFSSLVPIILLFLCSILSSCTYRPTKSILDYRVHGQIDLARQRDVVDSWISTAEPDSVSGEHVEILQSFPNGITSEGGIIRVEEGWPFEIIGRFVMNFYVRLPHPTDEQALDEVRRLAVVAGGDVVVCSLRRERAGFPKIVRAAGYVIRRIE